jgi:hypothetical protein
MKQSHLTTPRTLSDCTFTTGYSSYRPSRYEWQDHLVVWASAGALAALSVIVYIWG